MIGLLVRDSGMLPALEVWDRVADAFLSIVGATLFLVVALACLCLWGYLRRRWWTYHLLVVLGILLVWGEVADALGETVRIELPGQAALGAAALAAVWLIVRIVRSRGTRFFAEALATGVVGLIAAGMLANCAAQEDRPGSLAVTFMVFAAWLVTVVPAGRRLEKDAGFYIWTALLAVVQAAAISQWADYGRFDDWLGATFGGSVLVLGLYLFAYWAPMRWIVAAAIFLSLLVVPPAALGFAVLVGLLLLWWTHVGPVEVWVPRLRWKPCVGCRLPSRTCERARGYWSIEREDPSWARRGPVEYEAWP